MIETVVFKADVAVRYGTNIAVVLGNIHYWVEHNKANGSNLHDGRYWTFNSVAAFHKLFPFMSEKSIYTALSKAEAEGLIVTGYYNKLPFDRTKWYSLTEKGEALFDVKTSESRASDCPDTGDSISQNWGMDDAKKANDIPPDWGTNTIDNQTNNPEEPRDMVRRQAASQRPAPSRPWNDEERERVEEVVDHLNALTGARYRATSKATSKPILARLREGFTVEELKTVADRKAREWLGTDMAQYLRPQTLYGSKCEAYLNAPEAVRDRTQSAIARNVDRYKGIIEEDEAW